MGASQTGCSSRSGSEAGGTAPQVSNAPFSIGELHAGKRLGTHGGIAPGAETHSFALGDTVHIAMRVQNAPAGTVVKVVWKTPGGQTMGEDSTSVRPGQEYVHFSADSENLQVGQGYQAEVSANGKSVGLVRFDLT